MARTVSPDVQMLIAEGERLAKPCLLLQSSGGGSPIGVWKGEGQRPRPKGYRMEPGDCAESTHWITVDCTWLKQRRILPVQGLLSVYERTFADGSRSFVAMMLDKKAKLANIEGEPLYGVEAISFPPFEALCMHGGPAVEEWLGKQDLRRIDYEDFDLNESPAVRAYRKERRKRNPWLPDGDDGTAAVLGGWHVMWPEDDWYMPPDIQLAIWTFRDSEPWIEVWRGRRNFVVFERTT